jgi:hypothetical protein
MHVLTGKGVYVHIQVCMYPDTFYFVFFYFSYVLHHHIALSFVIVV